ncbi:transcriptional regulator [Arenicella chitinivorans]|uniref:Transcriptional regulator n=1 Tax=Arenicella chitinivorans TaxID=1329800 RepID=A0A918VPH3_9GAMM|nr:metalloregulator ArsR/SmtB family transcription factor [Arenicella chitinivorans]GHA12209.1 transcriptional regulator [Arenicella chitinivorans]
MQRPELLFKCLSDPNRLKLVLLLDACGEACVCDLMAALGVDQPKVSRYLAELRRCDILQADRRGKWVYYMLHSNLPMWAKHVIRSSAEGCTDYVTEELSRLHQSKGTACV